MLMAHLDIAVLWEKAIRRYEEESKLKLPANLSAWPADSMTADTILEEAQRKQKAFGHFRKKRQRLWNALKPFSSAVKLLAHTIGQGVKLVFPPAEVISAATVLLLKTAEGVSTKYDAIADMLEALGDFLDRLSVYTKVDGDANRSMEKMVIENLSQVLVVLGLATTAVREGRTVAYFKELIGKNSKIQEAMTKLEQLSVREGQAVGVATLSATQKILELLEARMIGDTDDQTALNKMLLTLVRAAEVISSITQQNQSLLEDLKCSMSDIPRHIVNEHERTVREWLDAPDSSSNFHEAHRKRTQGTGAWLIHDRRYQDWKNGSERQSILWLSGRPGCGKSVLSSTAIEDIELEMKADPNICIAYFYFDFRDPRKQDCRGLVSSLIDQMTFAFYGIPSCLNHLHSQRRSSYAQPSYDELYAVMQQICANRHTLTYFIIDALDECKREEWYELVAMLESLQNWELRTLRILCTSRREEELAGDLASMSNEINLESSIVDVDIARYLETALAEDRRFARWRNRMVELEEIRETLAKGAKGMFRWAYCQLESLAKCITRKDLHKVLQNLPKTLHETYERILRGIDDDHYQYAYAVLKWLCFSYEPVKLEGVAEVLAIDHGTEPPTFDPDERLPDSRDILVICASLVTLSKDGYLELAHFSVKEYLLSGLSGSVKRYAMDVKLAHSFIAQSCLVYLLELKEPVHDEVFEQYPLSYYAARFWVYHYSNPSPQSQQELTLSLFCSTEQFKNWIRICDPDDEHDRFLPNFYSKDDDIPKPIYYAALIGLTSIVQFLLANGADVNVEGGSFGTPLLAASYQGHDSVVKLLLENSADVNFDDVWHGTPLHEASFRGFGSIAKLLLDHGADVNARGGRIDSPLQVSSYNGHESIVKLLLEHGADVDALEGQRATALQEACHQGHESIVKLLLANGANVNAADGQHGTALQAASRKGQDSIAKLLLDNGADFNALGRSKIPALHTACYDGQVKIAKLLLEYGADVNALGGGGVTALEEASHEGHELIVKLLLDHGADVNARGGNFETALQAASNQGHESIVKMLLDHGAHVPNQSAKHEKSQDAAVHGRHKPLVKFLLDDDAGVISADQPFYGTPSQSELNINIVQISRSVLENDAAISYRDRDKSSRVLRRVSSTPSFDAYFFSGTNDESDNDGYRSEDTLYRVVDESPDPCAGSDSGEYESETKHSTG